MFAILEGFLHTPWLLVGLAALAIPPIIHLLNRRRFDVVDWGAMQFLNVSEVTRRRLMLEEVLLMLVRMGLLGLLVFALAGPFLDVQLPAGFGPRASRDVVLILDGSASMTATDELSGSTPAERAREWARSYIEELSAGDGVALLVAREQVEPLLGTLSSDRPRVRDLLTRDVYSAGTANWPEAVKQAHAILGTSQKARREVILLGDDQKFGWADPDSLFRWDLLASELSLKSADKPRLWAVNLAPGRESAPPNYGLAPLVSNRPVVAVDREVTFKTELLLVGQTSYSPPYKIRLEVDGKHVRDLTPPARGAGMAVPRDGRVPFSFTHRFQKAGSHLISVVLEPDPPPEDRPQGYVLKDRVPGDNRQDYSAEVLPALPVLIVDGAASPPPTGHLGSDFLRDALSPARDRTPAVQARVVAAGDFVPSLLTGEPRPLVLVLHDVPRLSASQAEGVAAFLAEGGGVLVTLGERAEQGWYNEQLYRAGDGWLPARLDGIAGEEARPQDAVRPDPATFAHPILELFQKQSTGGLSEARFPRWWRLTTPGQHSVGVPVGQLTAGATKTPLFVERAFKAGRVMLSAVPLDASWGSNLVDLPAFVPLVHEAVYYLAGARSAEYNLRAGQPLRLRVSADATLDRFQLQPPGGPQWPLSSRVGEAATYPARLVPQEHRALLVYEGVRDTGVYRVLTPQQQTVFFVVPADPREADLTACSAEEREKVAKAAGVEYEDDREAILGAAEGATTRQELWWWLMVGLIGFLCLEVWMTRRLVRNR